MSLAVLFTKEMLSYDNWISYKCCCAWRMDGNVLTVCECSSHTTLRNSLGDELSALPISPEDVNVAHFEHYEGLTRCQICDERGNIIFVATERSFEGHAVECAVPRCPNHSEDI